MRRAARNLSSVLMLTGLLLLADGGATLLWQEPITAAIGTIRRDNVDTRYLSYRSAPLSHAQKRTLDSIRSRAQRIRYLATTDSRRIRTGAAIGEIEIPGVTRRYKIIQGTGTAQLEAGPGHYPATALPGMGRTTAIAGHRTTYLAPFKAINRVTRGHRIVVTMPYGTFTYVVQYQQVVDPHDVGVVRDVGYDRLVLSACHPLYSAKQRFIVFARLRSVAPARIQAH